MRAEDIGRQFLMDNKILQRKVQQRESDLNSFLTSQQIASLGSNKVKEWNHETIMKALRMRFHLGRLFIFFAFGP